MRNLELEQSVKKIEFLALPGIPFVKDGDDIASLILEACRNIGFSFKDKDILVIAHKIVSRAEGQVIPFSEVTPTPNALELARKTGRDPRHCELILQESRRIVYTNGPAIITEHRLGFVNTSSGVDRSNSGSKTGELAVLLPEDPDKSAEKIREGIISGTTNNVAVVISDSLGRPWRKGSVGMAIGVAGINPLKVEEKQDLAGRTIRPEIALVDEIAAGASIMMGQANEGFPVVIVRGAEYVVNDNPQIKDLLRPYEEDQIWE